MFAGDDPGQATSEETACGSNGSISFLQQEHARTLKGLHVEIHRLQQKCARLTFELTMAGGNTVTNQAEDTGLLEEELRTNQEQISMLKSRLTLQKEKESLLEHELRTVKREHEKLQREKQDLIRTTQQQLDDKSTTIAQLVSKLHQTQLFLYRIQQQQQTVPAAYYPTPPIETPPDGTASGRIVRRLRRSMTSPHPPSPGLDCPSDSSISSESPRQPMGIPQPKDLPKIPGGVRPGRRIVPLSPAEKHFQSKEKVLLHEQGKPQRTIRQRSILPPIGSTEAPPTTNYHREQRYVLSKGLSSAPPCSMRLVNYSTAPSQATAATGGGYREDLREEEEEQVNEGTIIIKHQLNNQGTTESLFYKPQSQRK